MSKMAYPQASGGLPLRDIHLPPNPSWWPLAPGWWVVLCMVLASVAVALMLYRRVRYRKRQQAKMLAELEQLTVRHGDEAVYASAVHQFLRRMTRRYAAEAHHLQGESWRDALAKVPVDAATLDVLMTLEARMYQPHAPFDRHAVEAAARRWVLAAIRHSKKLGAEVGHA